MEPEMSYQLTIIQKPAGYLHAIVTGLNSKENVKAYLADVLEACKIQGCNQVLIEERLEGPRIDTINVFQIASEGSRQAMGFYKAIAYVDVNAEGELMKFAETVAVNRSLPVRLFSSVADAERWLVEKDREGTEPLNQADTDTTRR